MIWLTCESINDPPREAETIGRFAPHGGKIEQKQFAALFKTPTYNSSSGEPKKTSIYRIGITFLIIICTKSRQETPWSKPKKSL